MPPVAPKKWNAAIWIKTLSITRALLENSIINDAKVDAAAAIAQSKIANLVTDLAARTVRAADETIGGNWTFSNPVVVAAGVNSNHAVNKSQLDASMAGLDGKAAVVAAFAAALPANTRTGNVLEADVDGALPSADGIALSVNDRVIVPFEGGSLSTPHANNGIYTVTSLGGVSSKWQLTRATDFDENTEVRANVYAFVSRGTTFGDKGLYIVTNAPITVNTTALEWSVFTGLTRVTAGDALSKNDATETLNVNVDGVDIYVNGSNQLAFKKAWRRVHGTATASQTSIAKGGGDPAIINDNSIRVVIDHQVLYPTEWEFVAGGGSINVYAMEADQDYLLEWYA